MKKLFMLLIFLSLSGVTLYPRVDYRESKYTQVAANTVDDTGGSIIPNGETVALYRAVMDGADPSAYVSIVYCYGDPTDEKIFISTRGDVDIKYDISLADVQVTGNGTCKIKLIITNDNTDQTPVIGGFYEVLKI